MGVAEPVASASSSASVATWARSLEWRAAARLPLPAWTAGLLLTAAMIAVYTLFEWIFGPLGGEGEPVLGPLLAHHLGFALSAAVAGYALSAGAAIASGNAADRASLRLGRAAAIAEPTRAGGNLAGAFGLVAGVLFMSSVDEAARDLVLGRRFSGDGAFSILSVTLAFWLATRAAWFTLAELTAVARAISSTEDLDPLETERVEPLGRMALRAALLWAGAATLASLTFAITEGSLAELAATLFLVGVAVGSFLIPVRGVHAHLHGIKHAELARVRSEIRRDREAVAGLGPESSAAALRLPGLLAFEARIADAREWPFDASTLRRFGIVLLLPLASWLGGALVERGLDRVLD